GVSAVRAVLAFSERRVGNGRELPSPEGFVRRVASRGSPLRSKWRRTRWRIDSPARLPGGSGPHLSTDRGRGTINLLAACGNRGHFWGTSDVSGLASRIA